MKLKFKLIIALLFSLSTGWGQNDFSISWNAYMTGDTTSDHPFNGSFTITNVGETTIMMDDTVWFGYEIEDIYYDLGLSIGLVSAKILESDLLPGESFSVPNGITWPYYWPPLDTINVCAVVYGEGSESHTGDLFTGDIDTTNNFDCVYAITPDYAAGIDDKQVDELVNFSFSKLNGLKLHNYSSEELDIICSVATLSGQHVLNKELHLLPGDNQYEVPIISAGVYIVSVLSVDHKIQRKIWVQ